MKSNKKFLGMLLIFTLFISRIPFNSWALSEEEMKNQVVNVYNAAKRAKGVTTFENICPSATGYQMIEMGLITKGVPNDYPNYNADGKNWFPFYKERNGSVTSKGYRVICAEGANCLQDLVNRYGIPLFNIIVSYGEYGGNSYGHVMFIHAIIGDKVYFTDNFAYGNSPEGDARVWTINEYNQRYQAYNGNALGAVYFQSQNVFNEGFTTDGRYQYSDGSFAVGWKDVGGDWYYFKGDGFPIKSDWVYAEGNWYYLTADGRMATGWKNINGKKYYLDETGRMATEWLRLGRDYYYLGLDGVLVTKEWIYEGGNKYYMGSDGKMNRDLRAIVDGVDYEFDDSGAASKMTANVQKNDTIAETKETIESTVEYTDEVNQKKEETQYSYKKRELFYEYMTSEKPELLGWEYVEDISEKQSGEWSDWTSDYIEEANGIEVESRELDTGEKNQIYLGRYYSESKNNFSPNKLDNTYSFEGGWFDEDMVTFVGQAFAGGRSDTYKVSGYHYYFFEIGDQGGLTRSVSTGKITEYRYRENKEKVLFRYRRQVYGEWSDWSEWSNVNPGEPNEFLEVRTRVR